MNIITSQGISLLLSQILKTSPDCLKHKINTPQPQSELVYKFGKKMCIPKQNNIDNIIPIQPYKFITLNNNSNNNSNNTSHIQRQQINIFDSTLSNSLD